MREKTLTHPCNGKVLPSATWTFCLFSYSQLSLSCPALFPRSLPWSLWSWGDRARLCPSWGRRAAVGQCWRGGGKRQRLKAWGVLCKEKVARGRHGPLSSIPYPAPVPLWSHTSGKQPMCLPGLLAPQNNRLFRCVFRCHVRLMDPHELLFWFCCH